MTEHVTTATNPSARYRAAADRFTQLVHGTRDWDAPSPVEQWRARDVVGHLVEWFPTLLASGCDLRIRVEPSIEDDPVAAWESFDRQVQALLVAPTSAQVTHEHEHTGSTALPQLIDQYLTTDVVLHGWDLARATGQDDTLEPGEVSSLLTGMSSVEEVIRSSGQFGEQQPLPKDPSDQDRLIAFIGRDPRWTPSG